MKRTILTIIAAILLFATPSLAADLHMAWDPSAGATGYKLQISLDHGVSWGEIRDTGSTTPEYTWVGAPNAGLVLFRVMAYSPQGEAWNTTHGVWANEEWVPPPMASGLGIK